MRKLGKSGARRIAASSILLGIGLISANAHGVILHPADDSAITPANRPNDAVIGRWGGNASAVAVGPNHIITTRHQGGGVGTTVVFGGTPYTVAEINNIGVADLRVVRIEQTVGNGGGPANLANYVGIYENTLPNDEFLQTAVISGFGKIRDDDVSLTDGSGVYAYAWDNVTNTNQRFGQNLIEAFATATGTFTTDVMLADFDARLAVSSVTAEAAVAEFDSGGGWFLFDGSQWRVAGLNRAVEHLNRSIFRANTADPDDPGGRDGPDVFDAVRLSSYADDINAIVPEPSSMALLLAGGVAMLGRRHRTS